MIKRSDKKALLIKKSSYDTYFENIDDAFKSSSKDLAVKNHKIQSKNSFLNTSNGRNSSLDDKTNIRKVQTQNKMRVKQLSSKDIK